MLKVVKDSQLVTSFIKNNSLKRFRFPSRLSYSLVASEGKKLNFALLTLKVLPATDSCNRFCFVVKRKNGSAVFRNRCRRILRSLFFNEISKSKTAFWIMVIVEMNENNANWKLFKQNAQAAVKWLNAKNS